MAQPLISVVIPVYNQERYIEEAVLSVLHQEQVTFELIVVNDGSTDASGKLLRKYQDRILLLEQENLGVAEARNAGVRKASAELIAFLDGDDRYLPGHLKKMVDFASEHPEAILFYGDARVIDENGQRLWIQKSTPNPSLEKLLCQNFIISSSVVVRKNLFKQGEWFESFHPSEDWDLWLRAIRYGPFIHYPWLGVEYRKHPQSAIKTKKILAEEMGQKVLERAFGRYPQLDKKVKKMALSNVYYESMVRFLSGLDKHEARTRARLCLHYHPKNFRAYLTLLLTLFPKKFLQFLINFQRKLRKWMV